MRLRPEEHLPVTSKATRCAFMPSARAEMR